MKRSTILLCLQALRNIARTWWGRISYKLSSQQNVQLWIDTVLKSMRLHRFYFLFLHVSHMKVYQYDHYHFTVVIVILLLISLYEYFSNTLINHLLLSQENCTNISYTFKTLSVVIYIYIQVYNLILITAYSKSNAQNSWKLILYRKISRYINYFPQSYCFQEWYKLDGSETYPHQIFRGCPSTWDGLSVKNCCLSLVLDFDAAMYEMVLHRGVGD